MTGSTRQHEPVPDEVAVAQARIGDEEDGACRVGQATGDQPGKAGSGQEGVHWLDCDHDEPSHEQVKNRGQDRVGHVIQHLQHHAGQRQTPDQYQQRPSPCAMQHAECEWCVGARDEQIDSGVIDDAKGVFESARTE